MNTQSKLWTGRILTGFAVAFLLMDAIMKLMKAPVAVLDTIELGYPESAVVGIGVVLLACTILYVIPRTSIVGAVLLTGYLGGAVASQVRVGNPLFTNVLFPVYFATLVWAGLVLRNHRLRALLLSSQTGETLP